MPKVSVIMAVYNGERFLAEAIESILNQTFRDFEFIIINDASTDNTKNILEKYLQVDDRIFLINNSENQERAESRNKGLKIARGEYVSIVDSDDISLPDKLERQVRFLDEYIDFGFVGTSHFVIDENGDEQYLSVVPNTNLKEVVHFMCNPSILARRDCLEKAGGYRSVLVPAEDYDLWLRVSDICKAANISEPLFKYRVHASSSTALQKALMDVGTSLVLEMAEERKNKTGNDTLCRASQQDAEQMREQRLKTSWINKRKMLSHNFLTWSKAAYVLGEYNKSGKLAVNSLTRYPLNCQAICVVLKVIVRRLFRIAHDLSQYVFSKTYPNSRRVRSKYWNKRAYDIDEKWGMEDIDNKILADIITSFSPGRLLDIGCGSGRLFPLYDQFHIPEVVGQDISEEALRIATERYRFANIITTNQDILSLEYPEEYFGLVVSNRVLQHVQPKEIEKVIKKLVRIGRYIYINELADTDCFGELFYLFKHNYGELFSKQDYVLIKSGKLGKQTWQVFGKKN